MSLTAYRALLETLVRHDGRLVTADLDAALALAVARLGRDAPAERVEDLAVIGAGAALTLPVRWAVGLSGVRSAEYPIGTSPKTYLAAGACVEYHDAAGDALALYPPLPVGALVRLTYTSDYVLDATTDETPSLYIEAVAHYAAASLCRVLAGLYANTSDSTISADAVSYQSKSDQWRRLAKDYEARYYAAVGVDPDAEAGAPPAAGVVVDWDTQGASGRTPLYRRGR